jgi:hypothetical protein
MKKLIVQGTPGGEYLLIAKGRVAHGVMHKWIDVLGLAIAEDCDTLILDPAAIRNCINEVGAAGKVRP